MLNIAIGQGEMLMTPVQMACYIAAIGNGGSWPRPHILKEIVEDGRRNFRPTQRLHKIEGIPPGAMETIRKSLRSVVHDQHGTGPRARVPGFQVAGKTGTAQNPHGEDHSWFIAFAPFEHPTIAVAAVVENAGHGSAVAAPLVREVLKVHLTRDGETAMKNEK